MVVAECVQVNAVDILHHEVRLPAIAHAGVQHAGDVGVLERGQDVLFAGKTVRKERPCGVEREDLQRGALQGPACDPFDHVDRADAPGADGANDRVGPDPSVERRRGLHRTDSFCQNKRLRTAAKFRVGASAQKQGIEIALGDVFGQMKQGL